MKVYEMEVVYKPLLSIESLTQVRSPLEITQYLRAIWNDKLCYKESFYIVLVNRANRIIGHSLLSIGSSTGTVVDAAEVCKYAIISGASGVIISHNHPSGNLYPSSADIQITTQIKAGLDLFKLDLLDHIILTPDSFYSFADNGRI